MEMDEKERSFPMTKQLFVFTEPSILLRVVFVCVKSLKTRN